MDHGGIADMLNLDTLLAEADPMIPTWGIGLAGTTLMDSHAILRASHHPDREAVNQMLHQLVRRGHVHHGNDPNAAAVVCWLLIPALYRRLAGLHRAAPREVVNHHAACALWEATRTVGLANPDLRLAATLVWQVRGRVLNELGLTSSRDRSWDNTHLCRDDTTLEAVAAVRDPRFETSPDSETELWDLVSDAVEAVTITRADAHLLLCLVRTGEHHTLRGGLMSQALTAEVGSELGMGASTVRRRARSICQALEHNVRAA